MYHPRLYHLTRSWLCGCAQSWPLGSPSAQVLTIFNAGKDWQDTIVYTWVVGGLQNFYAALCMYLVHFLAHSRFSLSILWAIEWKPERELLGSWWCMVAPALTLTGRSRLQEWSQQNRDAPQEHLSFEPFSPLSYSFPRYWPGISLEGFVTQPFSFRRKMSVFVLNLPPSCH